MDQTISILVATDNHLGYNERDIIRGNDSFQTFEEILCIAHEQNVDCILLGGDLFHENKPSRKTLHRTMELLRHYCMGDRPCDLELLSDPAVNFVNRFGTANWEDPNYNVSMPVFVIHGNHDDPAGDGNLSTLDLLSTAGLVNYFGRTASVDEIKISPILLQKGQTKMALYGLGAIRDERLHRTFLRKRVTMLRPPDAESYFSTFVLHQNRAAHTPTGYIPERFLDSFIDLVIWGHEHECLLCSNDAPFDAEAIYSNSEYLSDGSYKNYDDENLNQRSTKSKLQKKTEKTIEESKRDDTDTQFSNTRKTVFIQPGSSVATSLSQGEVRKKHVLILKVLGKTHKTQAIPLKSVRPFVMRDIVLKRALGPKAIDYRDSDAVLEYLKSQVQQIIMQCRGRDSEDKDESQDESNSLPLIRLRVDHSYDGCSDTNLIYSVPNPLRFGQLFANKVANPRDIITFVRRRILGKATSASKIITPGGGKVLGDEIKEEDHIRVENLLDVFLREQRPELLPQNEFGDILRKTVDREDRDALAEFIKNSIVRTTGDVIGRQSILNASLFEKTILKGEFSRIREVREREWTRIHGNSIVPCDDGPAISRESYQPANLVEMKEIVPSLLQGLNSVGLDTPFEGVDQNKDLGINNRLKLEEEGEPYKLSNLKAQLVADSGFSAINLSLSKDSMSIKNQSLSKQKTSMIRKRAVKP